MTTLTHEKRSMAVVNTSVFCEQSKRTILPVDDFTTQRGIAYLEIIKPRLGTHNCRLLSAHIGPEKSSLDPVDINLAIVAVVMSFGRF